LIAKCTENNIPFTIVLNSGYFVTTIKPDSKKYYNISFEHTKKYTMLSDTEIICIAKEFAAHKIKNYISLFKQRYVKEQNVFIKELEETVGKIYEAQDVNSVRGFEGYTAKNIYQKLNLFIDDENFHIKKRNRINPDRINSLLNFGYYILFSRINACIRASGLNPYLGFLHSPLDNYESLVCDVEELFRSRIDRFIIKLINLKIISKDDFDETEKGMYLKREKVRIFLNQFEREWDTKSDGRNKNLSLGDNIYVQITIMKKWILENASLSFYKWEV
ncbi:MAG: CRISPR-associated endonuclease Cas1, partial [Candidatus Firestonebacteria bacterium]|nr:CRISPR-associated endonuclease Cas1 [Candidatus Firestonebacteria bacterium]